MEFNVIDIRDAAILRRVCLMKLSLCMRFYLHFAYFTSQNQITLQIHTTETLIL